MPIANRYTVAEVVDAAKHYVEATGRRVIFEYALIRGTNDTPEYAKKLAALLKGFQCHVNLIPLNEVKERGMTGTAKEEAKRFLETLPPWAFPPRSGGKWGRISRAPAASFAAAIWKPNPIPKKERNRCSDWQTDRISGLCAP